MVMKIGLKLHYYSQTVTRLRPSQQQKNLQNRVTNVAVITSHIHKKKVKRNTVELENSSFFEVC